MSKKILLFIIISILISLSFIESNKINDKKIKSINLSTDYEINQVLDDVELTGANTVNVPVVINIKDLTSNDISIDENSKMKAIKLIKILNEENIDIILEPFPWINNGSEYETEYNPKDKELFFSDWSYILDTLINDIANIYDVKILNVASNFYQLEEYENEWCNIIDHVKSKFDGLVTYRTSWWYTAVWDKDSINKYNKKLNNKIFSKVDIISIACYFELSDKAENEVNEILRCIENTQIYDRNQNIKIEIENFYNRYNKPIFFGELGFPKRNYASKQPWNASVSDIYNNEEQARCFEAYRLAFEDEEYIKGFSVFAMGQKSEDKAYYPSQESIRVISKWYD